MARVFFAMLTCAAAVSVAAAQSGAPSPAPVASPRATAAPSPNPAPSPSPIPSPSPTPVPLPYVAASPDPARGAAILKKAVAAHGGAAAIDAVQRVELKGLSGRTMPGQQPIEMASKTQMVMSGGLYRHELVTQAGPIATLLNREGAFVLLSGGSLPLPEAEASALQATAKRNLLVLLRTHGAGELKVVRVGAARLPEGEVEMVEFDLGGQKTVLAVDAKTGLVRQAIYSMPMSGATAQVVATYSDYRPLTNGVKYPFQSNGTVDGKPVFTSRLESVAVNGALDESLFTLPSPPPAPSEPLPWASPSPSGN